MRPPRNNPWVTFAVLASACAVAGLAGLVALPLWLLGHELPAYLLALAGASAAGGVLFLGALLRPRR